MLEREIRGGWWGKIQPTVHFCIGCFLKINRQKEFQGRFTQNKFPNFQIS